MGEARIPDDWTGDYCCYTVEWPKSDLWLAVLRGVLYLPYTGRFWNEKTGTITDAQAVIRPTLDTNLHLEETIMSCNQEMATALLSGLNAIALALKGNGPNCCENQGTGGSGSIPAPFNPTEQGNPSTDPPPTGFDSWEEFFSDKCAKATWFVKKLEETLGNMAILQIESLPFEDLILALGTAIVIGVSGGVIVAIAGFLIGAVAVISISTALSIVNDNEEDLICELYGASSASDSRDSFLSTFNGFVDSGVADPVEGYAIKSLMKYLVQSDGVNFLYEKVTGIAYPSGDCSSCNAGAGRYLADVNDPGTYSDWPTFNFTDEIPSSQYSGDSFYYTFFALKEEASIDVVVTGWTVPTGFFTDAFRGCHAADSYTVCSDAYSHNTNAPLGYTMGTMVIVSATPFTTVVTLH